MPVQDIPKELDPDSVRAMLASSQANFEALEAAWDDLLKDHEGEWVAAYKDDFVFGNSPQAVLAEAKSRGWALEVIAIDHLSRERPAILL